MCICKLLWRSLDPLSHHQCHVRSWPGSGFAASVATGSAWGMNIAASCCIDPFFCRLNCGLFSKYVAATQFLYFWSLVVTVCLKSRATLCHVDCDLNESNPEGGSSHFLACTLSRCPPPKEVVLIQSWVFIAGWQCPAGILGHQARAESRTTMMVICWGQSGIITQWMEGTREEPLPIRWNCSSDIAVHETCHVFSVICTLIHHSSQSVWTWFIINCTALYCYNML